MVPVAGDSTNFVDGVRIGNMVFCSWHGTMLLVNTDYWLECANYNTRNAQNQFNDGQVIFKYGQNLDVISVSKFQD